MEAEKTDVVIAGGGAVGLTLALALAKAKAGLAVTVVDRGRAAGGDGRASMIAAGVQRMLERLGVWRQVEAEAQPILDVLISDSRTGDTVRSPFLGFDGALENGEPYAHMVPNTALVATLEAAARTAGVGLRMPATVSDFAVDGAEVTVSLGDNALRAALLVAADGAGSRLRGLTGIRVLRRDYRQVGLVATIAHERPHDGRATQHFLPAGPLALLPLRGNRSSLVWCETSAVAGPLLAGSEEAFLAALTQRVGHRLGRLALEGRRFGYPLQATIARDFVRPRFALAGDAAHAIHPLAGQGLNLGFRDAAALAETLVETRRLGLDIGAIDVLERYQRWRRFDATEMTAVTDGLNRLFSNDNPLLRFGRDIGLGIVDRLPMVKDWMLREAAGLGPGGPRLLRGEAI